MHELIFTPVDIIMFVLGGMALGFVLGASLMKATMRLIQPPSPEEMIRELLTLPREDDGGEAFHEECGDR
jgi:uncharacterized protein YneF (UPF0154 family)